MKQFIILFFVSFMSISCQKANVCKRFEDYDNIENNPNCYTNYAADRQAPDIIRLNGYPFEEHKIENSEGYILVLHRIPNEKHSNPKHYPIFLQHGLSSASTTYLGLGNSSLAFLLSDDGYDVWMGNFRGNIYSSEHKNLTVNDDEYWKFGVDDLALVDLPLSLKYISKVTSTMGEIIYIGHSLGAGAAVMFASDKPSEAKSLLKIMYIMATGDSLKNTKSPIFNLLRVYDNIHVILETFGLTDLISNGFTSSARIRRICFKSSITLKSCFEVSKLVAGPKTSTTPDLVPSILSAVMLGTPLRVLKQRGDAFTNPISKYDFGKVTNMKVYGQVKPPQYKIENVQIPTYQYAAEIDWLADFEDSKSLYKRLPATSRLGFYKIPTENFNHLDFVAGSSAKELIYDHLLAMIRSL